MQIKQTTLLLDNGRPYLEYSDTDMYVYEENKMDDDDKVYEIAKGIKIDQLGQERVYAFWMDTAFHLLSITMISQGTIDRSLMPERETCQIALLAGAVSAILVHNHPSGDPEPSDIDIAITKKIKESLQMVGVKLVDHIVVGRNRYESLLKMGCM